MSHYQTAARVLLSLLLCLISSLPFTSHPSSAASNTTSLRNKPNSLLRVALDRNSIDYFLFHATPTGFQHELIHGYAVSLDVAIEILPVDSAQQGILAVQNGLADCYATSAPLKASPRTLLAYPLYLPPNPMRPAPRRIATWLFSIEKYRLFANAKQWLSSGRCKNLSSKLYCKFGENGYMRTRFEAGIASRHTLSAYDTLIKTATRDTRWDWRWIASIVYQESRFKPTRHSPRGAYGLMQMTPITARHFNVPDLLSPEAQINAGVNYLLWLDKQFERQGIPLSLRDDFILAAYNAGYSRIRKAQERAIANGASPYVWAGNVAIEHAKKHTHPDGNSTISTLYGSGETCNFVRQINSRFAHYKNLL